MSDRLEEAFAEAQAAVDQHRGNYYWEPIPVALDHVLQRFVLEYSAASDERRNHIADQLTPRQRDHLSSFGVRSASIAVRSDSVEPLIEGLVALRLGWPTEDVRERIRDLAPMYYAAKMVGADPVATFRKAGEIARSQSFESFLEDFVARSDEDKSLKALGFHIRDAPDGLRIDPGSSC